jgi:hypothetical protein
MQRWWITAIVAGCTWPGVRGSLGNASEQVVADFRAAPPAAKLERVDYLGEGCYIIDDRTLYVCNTDEGPAGKLTCRQDYWFDSLADVYVTEQQQLEPWPAILEPPINVTRDPHCERVWSAAHASTTTPPARAKPIIRWIDL